MRRLDDIIVNTLNAVVPTDSLKADPTVACKDLYQQLQDGNGKRKNSIKHCISLTANRLKQLKEQREEDNSNAQAKKALRTEQTKVRKMGEIKVCQYCNIYFSI